MYIHTFVSFVKRKQQNERQKNENYSNISNFDGYMLDISNTVYNRGFTCPCCSGGVYDRGINNEKQRDDL